MTCEIALPDTFSIVTTDVREGLAALPHQSVQTCITSPPYYQVRAYGTTPQVWGEQSECDHDWVPHRSLIKTGGAGPASAKQVTNHGTQATPTQHEYLFRNGRQYLDHRLDSQLQGGATCARCGAWLGELGSEPTVDIFVANIVEIMRGVRRVLRDDGTLWLNLGDAYTGSGRGPTGHNGIGNQSRRQGFDSPGARPDYGLGPKQLLGVPWRVALAMQADGWVLRSDIIWAKRSPMPESVQDRPTRSHEYLFLFAKRPRYYYDIDATRTPQATRARGSGGKAGYRDGHPANYGYSERSLHPLGKNLRDVWILGPEPARVAHYASYPTRLVRPCILAGTSAWGQCLACGTPYRRDYHEGASGWRPTCRCTERRTEPQIVLDIFCGTATTGLVARQLGRRFIGLELNPQYAEWGRERLRSDMPLFSDLTLLG